MSAGGAAARYVSVSELYCADEVELLLDEIRELEPTSCRGEEPQDFEIAGSGAARSPAPTERSWDSHAGYQRAPQQSPRRAVPLYCRLRYLRRPDALLTALIVVCGASSVSCVWAVSGLRGRLPLDSRPRLLALAALSSALLHAALLIAHVTRLVAVLPLRWDLLAMWTSVWSGLSLLTGGSLVLHALLLAPEYSGAPEHPLAILTAAASLGLTGALASWCVVCRAACACWRGRAGGAGSAAGAGPRGAYRAVPRAPAAAPGPSSSREL